MCIHRVLLSALALVPLDASADPAPLETRGAGLLAFRRHGAERAEKPRAPQLTWDGRPSSANEGRRMLLAPTNPIVLLPIQPAPLPHQFRFNVQIGAGIPKHKVVILPAAAPNVNWALGDQDTLEPCGFNKLLRLLLQYAEQQNLWGQAIQVCANYAQANGVVSYANQSAPQTLQLPVKPILINSPNKVDGLAAKGYPSLPASQGLRLLWTQLPPYLNHNAWFVGADNRLAAPTAAAGFDRYSFWISALGLPIKSSAGINGGDAFATLLKATRVPPGFGSTQATVAQIVAAATANAWAFDSCIFWNPTRLLFYTPGSGAPGFREYGAGGLQFSTLQQFAAGQAQTAIWRLGLYPHQPLASGLASVA
jgi:hypothetical protein